MKKAACIIIILCGILLQGICHVSEGNNGTSSDLLIRQKRLVGGIVGLLQSSLFLLNVLDNGIYHCPATLLSDDFAISSASCFIHRNTRNMRIMSRAIGSRKLHQIVRVILLNPHFNPAQPAVDNLALVRFTPPINFRASENIPILLYSRNLTTDHTKTHVINWGQPREMGARIFPPDHFVTFPVILLSYDYCRSIYRSVIGNQNFCGIGSNAREYCDTNKDTGVPLTKGNELLGIFVYRCNTCPTRPNIFMNLMDHGIRLWIHQHVPSLRLF